MLLQVAKEAMYPPAASSLDIVDTIYRRYCTSEKNVSVQWEFFQ